MRRSGTGKSHDPLLVGEWYVQMHVDLEWSTSVPNLGFNPSEKES